MNLYAATVKSGDSPLMVCTSETSIREIASEESICPPIMKPVSGSVVMMISRVGLCIPFLKAGILRRIGKLLARLLSKMHQEETKTNCMMVRVTGLGKANKTCFEEVLDITEAKYQIENRT
jgi:hypothetical protein